MSEFHAFVACSCKSGFFPLQLAIINFYNNLDFSIKLLNALNAEWMQQQAHCVTDLHHLWLYDVSLNNNIFVFGHEDFTLLSAVKDGVLRSVINIMISCW